MAIPDLKRYPWNLNMIKNVEETVVLTDSKRVFFLWVSPLFLTSREIANENEQFKETITYIYLIHAWSDKVFKGSGKSGIAIFAWGLLEKLKFKISN